jgi:serine O-acetyltransferase
MRLSLTTFFSALVTLPITHFTRFSLAIRRTSSETGWRPQKTQIGEGFYLGHWGTVVINPKVKIGKNCNIMQGVTIAQANRGKHEGVPEIGNEVWIGTNAVIVGKVKVGNNVLIAPNVYLNTDVPDNSVVVGNPAQIISKLNATEDYINHKV